MLTLTFVLPLTRSVTFTRNQRGSPAARVAGVRLGFWLSPKADNSLAPSSAVILPSRFSYALQLSPSSNLLRSSNVDLYFLSILTFIYLDIEGCIRIRAVFQNLDQLIEIDSSLIHFGDKLTEGAHNPGCKSQRQWETECDRSRPFSRFLLNSSMM